MYAPSFLGKPPWSTCLYMLIDQCRFFGVGRFVVSTYILVGFEPVSFVPEADVMATARRRQWYLANVSFILRHWPRVPLAAMATGTRSGPCARGYAHPLRLPSRRGRSSRCRFDESQFCTKSFGQILIILYCIYYIKIFKSAGWGFFY
jgi:hypothetical protein